MNNIFCNLNNTSSDSISSHQGDESFRSSNNFYPNKPRFNQDKKIMLDKRVFNKLMNFLKYVHKELRIDDKEFIMIEEFIQTENEEIGEQLLKPDHRNIEKIILADDNYFSSITVDNSEFNKIKEEIEKLKKEGDIQIKTIQSLTGHNSDLLEQVNSINSLLEEVNKEKENLINELECVKIELNTINEKTRHLNNKINFDSTKDTSELGIYENIPILNTKLIKLISTYLSPKDFFFFSHSNKTFNNILKPETPAKLKSTIEIKNSEINKLLNNNCSDILKEFEITDSEIERLMRDYIQFNKLPGVDLKHLLLKALKYIDNEIKKPLGIQVSRSSSENNIKAKKTSIFGSLFDKIVKKEKEISNNEVNNPRRTIIEYDNISDFDKNLVAENLSNNELNLDFDFASSDEIKNLLVQFFTSLKNSPQTISNFIAELISEYSDFLFYSQITLYEIRELDVVKSAIHERFRKHQKICHELEAELEDLQKFARTNKEIKDILHKQKQEIEVKYTDSLTQVTYLKDEINKTSNKLMAISDKYKRMESEYDNFKSKLIKEFKLLKNEYDNVNLERNNLKDAIFEFKRYFMRFHITDDGDIAYIEDIEQ